jgi:hypothetical protein
MAAEFFRRWNDDGLVQARRMSAELAVFHSLAERKRA